MTRTARIRLATRGSPLALLQARRVATLIEAVGAVTEIVAVETTGDRRLDLSLERFAGQGIFVKEVQAAVVRGEADAAVHSAKDLPSSPELAVPGLVLAAVPERADPRDLLVGGTVGGLPTGSMVATGSARRRAQLANLRPDLTFTGLRGNLERRLLRAGAGGVTAVVVAAAAVERLGWAPPRGVDTEVLSLDTMVPQVGQGAIAVECREDDRSVRALLARVDDPVVAPLVASERAFLAALGGGCTLPVGASSYRPHVGGDEIAMTGMVASPDGAVVLRNRGRGRDPDELGASVARALLDEDGGRALAPWSFGSDGDGLTTVVSAFR